MRLTRCLIRSRRRVVVGYTKAHPIYTDVLEDAPPDGFAGYRRSDVRWLQPLDRHLRARVRIVHCDAANMAVDFGKQVPLIVECEGRPRDDFLQSPRIKRVFVESRWAGGPLLERGDVTLLRPSVRRPPRRMQRRRETDPIVLLAVGYGALVKGFDVAVRIFDVLRTEVAVRLVIAGTVPHNRDYYPEISPDTVERERLGELEHRLRSDPCVDFRPRRRSQMGKVYASADVYLHFSRLETFGYSILEAMSYGLPVVATHLNAIPEMVDHGRSGYLCDPGGADINSLAWQERVFRQGLEATQRLARDPALRMTLGSAGRERVAHAFDIDVKRARLAAAYRDAMAPAAPLPVMRDVTLSTSRP